MLYTRREFGQLAAVALPAIKGVLRKPDSKVAGVQIGLNMPYNFGDPNMTGDDILRRCVELDVSAIELRAEPVESFLGAPLRLLGRNADAATADELNAWRRSVVIDKARAFRRQYEDAGVSIQIVKFDNIYKLPDDVLDYCFELTKALGGRALSCEISLEDTKRLGQFADKHRLRVGYHGHTATTPAMWETAFGYAEYNCANVDLGHFIAGNNASPVPFIERHHDRITHVHVKDRKLNNGPNVPFGQGDTPISEVLRLIRDQRWPIQATIEFEYPVPSGSDRMKEMAKCIQYCRRVLA